MNNEPIPPRASYKLVLNPRCESMRLGYACMCDPAKPDRERCSYRKVLLPNGSRDPRILS